MVGLQPDRSTVAAVAAVWATLRDMGLTAKRHSARPTVAAANVEPAFIDELGHGASLLSGSSEPDELPASLGWFGVRI